MKVLLERKEKKKITRINVLGLIGALLWALAIFLRETTLMQNEIISFLLGIAPNFGVGLLLPMFTVIYYPILFKKDITFKKFILILIAIFLLLFVSEVVHDKFLNSRFDFYDMIASLIALGVMILSYNKKVSN
jgi:cation transport ATPase